MTSTLDTRAVPGRRILYGHTTLAPDQPGIITRINDGFGGGFFIRLDGHRSQLLVPAKFEARITYLDDVVPVQQIPIGRFTPTVDDLDGVWEGVPVCCVSEDGNLILFTTDRDKAVAAAIAYEREMGLEYFSFDFLTLRWTVFDWQPEEAEADWVMTWSTPDEDQAIRLYYLPA